MIDRLQSWFDGGDWFNLGIGLLSFGAAAWSLVRQKRIDAVSVQLQTDNLSLQNRLAEIEEARRNEEIAKASEADVRVNLKTVLDGRQKSWQTVLTIENRDGATAENVMVEEFAPVAGSFAVNISQLPASIPSIMPGDKASFTIFDSMGADDVFAGRVSWDDPRGQPHLQRITT